MYRHRHGEDHMIRIFAAMGCIAFAAQTWAQECVADAPHYQAINDEMPVDPPENDYAMLGTSDDWGTKHPFTLEIDGTQYPIQSLQTMPVQYRANGLELDSTPEELPALVEYHDMVTGEMGVMDICLDVATVH
jgi:hypothetical protein